MIRLILAIPVYALACLCGIVLAFSILAGIISLAHADRSWFIVYALTALIFVPLSIGTAAIARTIHGPH
jgi:hypothetical protein